MIRTLRPRSFSELWFPGFLSSVIYWHRPIPNGAFPAASNTLDPTSLRTFPTPHSLSWVCTILLLKKELSKFPSLLINLLIFLGTPIYFSKLQRWVNVLGINSSTIPQMILFIRMTVSDYALLNSPKHSIFRHLNFRLTTADTVLFHESVCNFSIHWHGHFIITCTSLPNIRFF